MTLKFSVLISVYYTENPKHLDRAFQSIWLDQILKPNQIVLIKDGSLTKDIEAVLDDWQKKLGNILSILSLESNVGLGMALGLGIHYCNYNLVARMDTDDVSLPNRFLRQVKFFEDNPDVDIVGSNIGEFHSDEKCIISYRHVPHAHDDIVRASKIKNPFNHPSVMYKKSAVLAAGGPKNMTGFDDYYLWIRMIMNGSKCANIPDVLLIMRTDNGQMSRRGGYSYLMFECKFQKILLDIKYINILEFVRNILIRLPVRLLPNNLRKYVYKLIRR
jgi:glycosyltransferase involved in cell wall biosynthesis